MMSASNNTFENVKAVILSAHKSTTSREKVDFYNSWAENYDQDVAVLDYRAPGLAANSISSHFSGDREAAVVLDVACGTGLVAKQMKRHGFGQFVGIDGSKAMLELARESGLYLDLKHSMLGEEPIPFQWDSFDVVVIVGALSVGQVPVGVVRELCKSTKPGGYVCMTTRSNLDNLEYRGALERELKQMEEEGLWSCVAVTEVEDWERAVSEQEDGYISGAVYLYKKLQLN
ncbi:methyltransferase-like protein 27 isoform X2 [Xiphias gladius]|uniref:methyltransferase-like protein 27 isoform X2 n=1 Tax=Xiphias gladius TaxID=8245 RepID=UPI001A989D32|nr:methyltransferase-like protein 27 isoform X2 [Xiphias gladius]XP_040005978.1 methyltransferase-like protein 27 isoform X2 [Xiphias gladius]